MDFMLEIVHGMGPLAAFIGLAAILLFGLPFLLYVWFRARDRYKKWQEERQPRRKPASQETPIENVIVREIGRFILVMLLFGLIGVLAPVLFVGFFFSPLWLGWLAEQSPLAVPGLVILIIGGAYWVKRLGDLRGKQGDN